jgi:PAS domain S-box-containing protein
MALDEVIVPGYTPISVVGKDGSFVVFRASSSDKNNFLVKAPISLPPPVAAVNQLEREYDAARALDPAFAVQPLRIERHGDTVALILGDFACQALSAQLAAPLDVGRFLAIAVAVAAALAALHRQGVVHKDIKPANIFLATRRDGSIEAKLTGFGAATTLLRERQAPEPPEFIAGTLAYMAPEQTGRMNRSIDSRSDLYSLGITLYQMLAGHLPFSASAPLEWVHCHIALQPPPPSRYRGDIPEPLAAIVMKLLAKNAEDRYQTAEGLKADLERCAAEWRECVRITPFALGECDIPDRLLIPEKLYGREREVEALLAAFDRAATGGKLEFMLVSGYSGIGKSALVNELHKALVPARGLFASGKLDQHKCGIPYGALAQAFSRLIHPLLGMSEAALEGWRRELNEALGLNGRLILDLVPDLAFIIGEQPAVPELEPGLAKNRFQLVFRRFIEAFARPEHPLALFLDDLQWLDAATLDLIEDLLIRQDVRHLLLIGAYRDNEVPPDHPLMRRIGAIRAGGAEVREINLGPLSREHLTRLIADSLHCECERAIPLAHLIHAKTGGNPFFANQFLSALAQVGLVFFDHGHGRWSWDLGGIRAKGYTDNVADLMAGMLTQLADNTQRTLRDLACLGNVADARTLSPILDMPEEDVHAALAEAVGRDLVQRLNGSYRFVHDRVHEASYASIPKESRAAAHLRIGRALLAHTPPEKRGETIFEIVSQLNRGAALMAGQDERDELAALNLIAGRRAKASTAYAAGLSHFAAGMDLLADDPDGRQGELMFALALNRAECEYLTGDLDAAEQRLDALAESPADPAGRAAVAVLRINLYMTRDRSGRAIEVGLQYLDQAGIRWSSRPSIEGVEHEFERLWQRLEKKPIESIADLPLMSEAGSRATMDVLTALMPPALFTDRNLQCLLIARMANLSLEHGNTDGSCFAYVWLGMLLGPQFDDYRAGYRFGQLAVDLVETQGLLRFKARVCLGFGHVVPWTRHVRMGVPYVRTALETAQATGDLSFATISFGALITHLLACGEPLAAMQREAEAAFEFARKARFGLIADMVKGQLGLIRTLRGLTPQFGCFTDAELDEGRFEEHLAAEPRLAYSGWRYWIRKLQARYYAADYAAAIEAEEKARRLLSSSFLAYFEVAEYHFYAALARAAYVDSAPASDRPAHLDALSAHLRQLELWSRNCPENFECRAALVAAEVARLEGRVPDATRLYEQAIRSARANAFIHDEAVAYETAGCFYLGNGLEAAGLAHLREAHDCYALWGADGKVRQLERRYPRLAERPIPATRPEGERLDAAAVAKASETLSSAIELPQLIETLMTIALENAGADRGLLIMPDGAGWRMEVEAKATIDGTEVTLCRSVIDGARCPETVVNAVLRTRESIIINDASRFGEFFEDPYLRRGAARSVFCLPLPRQGSLAGVLHLENSQTVGAFTPDRTAVLELLAAQAAISLENARLYGTLRESEEKYSRIVNTASEGIWMVDPEGATLFVNAKMGEMLGWSPDEMAGRLLTDFLFEEDALEQPQRMERRRRGLSENFERRFRHRDGHTVWAMVSAAPIFDDQHRFAGAVGMHTDITERHRVEAELRHYKEHLEETVQQLQAKTEMLSLSNADLEQFAYVASHDLQTPLRNVVHYAQLLERRYGGVLDEDGKEFIGFIVGGGMHMSTLIADLLEYARISNQGKPLEPVASSEALAQALRNLKMEVEASEAEIVVGDLPEVFAEPARLVSVFQNLIGNAIKYRDKDRRLVIGVCAEKVSPELWRFAVSDNGIGIAEEYRERIFKIFERLGPTKGKDGTGIGLTLCRRIVHRFGGRIWVESEPGAGSTFYFTVKSVTPARPGP